MRKEYFENAIWHRKKINGDPISEVPYIFSQFSHDELRIFIFRMLDAAYRYDIWNDGPVSRFIQYMETLEYGIDIAHKLYQNLLHKDRPVPEAIKPAKDRPVTRAAIFLYKPIPRMMTISELKDPTRFIKQFFRFAELKAWKRILKDRTILALDVTDARSLEYPVDGLVLYSYLSKMVDLLYVIKMQLGETRPLV